jgi:hypothetical protein
MTRNWMLGSTAGTILIRYVGLPWSNGKPSDGRDSGVATTAG